MKIAALSASSVCHIHFAPLLDQVSKKARVATGAEAMCNAVRNGKERQDEYFTSLDDDFSCNGVVSELESRGLGVWIDGELVDKWGRYRP